jgi:hypothetical protein
MPRLLRTAPLISFGEELLKGLRTCLEIYLWNTEINAKKNNLND